MNRSIFGAGSTLALVAAIVSGISVYVAKLGTEVVPDPFVYTTARNLTVGLALLALLAVGRHDVDFRSISRLSWLHLCAIAIFGGSVPFLLFFWGLTITPAATASLIQKTLFVWVALFAAPLLGEKLNRLTIVALSAILIGIAVQGPLTLSSPGLGVALVLAATFLWAGETILVRRTLRDISPLLAATVRMAGGGAIMLVALGLTGRLPTLVQLSQIQIFWVVTPSILLLAYVLTWFAALRAAPAVVVTSILALGAPVTALIATGATSSFLLIRTGGPLAQWLIGSVPIMSTGLLIVGCALLVTTARRAKMSKAIPR